jgi:hypothetical protein
MQFTSPDAHPFHKSNAQQFGALLELIDEMQIALRQVNKRLEEAEAALAAGSAGSGHRTDAPEPQPQLPAEAQNYCRITYGIDKFPKNTQTAILKHAAALCGLPSPEDLQSYLVKMEHGKAFDKQDLMARWVVGEREFAALTYFLQKINQIEFSSRQWHRVAK